MPLEDLDKRLVASRKRLLEYVIKIAGWLMSVNDQN
jgi:hypothetical protein